MTLDDHSAEPNLTTIEVAYDNSDGCADGK